MTEYPPHVQQLLAERLNVLAYGNTVRVAAIDKQLSLLGAAEKRQQAAERSAPEPEEARTEQPPVARRARPRETTGGE